MKNFMVKLKIPTTPNIPHDSLFVCLVVFFFVRYYILPGLADQRILFLFSCKPCSRKEYGFCGTAMFLICLNHFLLTKILDLDLFMSAKFRGICV